MTFSINLSGPPWIFLHGSKCGFHICAFLPSRAQCWRLQTQNTHFGKGFWPWLWWHQDSSRVSLREIHSPGTEQDTARCGSKDESNSGLQGRKLLQNLKFLTLMDVLRSCTKFWTSASRTHCRGDTDAKSRLVEVWNHNRSCHSLSFFNAQVQKWCQSSPLRSSNSIKCPQVRPVGATAAGCHTVPGYFY